MSQERATSWVQVPMLERKAPIQSRRKLWKTKAERKPGSREGSLTASTRGSTQSPALDRAHGLPVVRVDAQGGDRGVALAQGARVRPGIGVRGLGPDVPEVGLVLGVLPPLVPVEPRAEAVGDDPHALDVPGREVQRQERAPRQAALQD